MYKERTKNGLIQLAHTIARRSSADESGIQCSECFFSDRLQCEDYFFTLYMPT